MNSRSSSATAKSTISTATSRSSLTPEFLARLKIQRKATLHRIEIKDLPPEERISQLRSGRKHFIDTIKLIAYRSETALVHLARETLHRSDDARSFVRGLMQTAVNLRPDPAAGELRIELHGQANPIHDAVVAKLCEELNATETHYPGTNLRLKYVPLRSPDFLPDQDV